MATEADVATEGEAALLLSATAPGYDDDETPLPPRAGRVLRHLLIAVLFFVTAVAMTVPVRPLLILDAAGNDASAAAYFTGLVDCLQAILSIFASPLFGAVSDVIGRKPILVLSHLGELVGLLLVASFPKNLYLQFPAYIVIALTNAYVTTANTIIADISTYAAASLEEGQAQVSSTAKYGYLGAAYGVCFMVGPALGGFIEDRFYLASSFHAACVLIVIAMLYVTVFLPETKPAAPLNETSAETDGATTSWLQRTRTSVTARAGEMAEAVRSTELNPLPRVQRIFAANEALWWIAVTIATASLAMGALNSIMFLYVNVRLGWESKETGLFLSAVGLSLLISQGVLAPLAVRVLGEIPTILLGYSLAAVHYFVYAMARSSATMYIGLFIGMFSFVADPAMKGLLARQVPIHLQGSLQGSVSALTTVVRPFSPIMSAALFGYGNSIGRPGLPFQVIALISAMSVLSARVAFMKPGLK